MKEALLSAVKVRLRKEYGRLLLFEDDLEFVGEKGRKTFSLYNIRSQFKSAATSKKIILKLTPHEELPGFSRNLLFSFESETGLKDRNSFSDLISALAPSRRKEFLTVKSSQKRKDNPSTTNPTPAKKPRESLHPNILKSNPDLQRAYQMLVVDSEIVSEHDFWASRSRLIETAAVHHNQQKGLPSNYTENSATVKLTLTPHKIQRIFQERPAVKRAYTKWVPTRYSEREFWTKYFQSAYFNRKNDKETDPMRSTDDREMAKLVQEGAGEVERGKLKLVERTVDLTRDDETRAADLQHRGGRAGSQLLQDFNRNSAVILQGIEGNENVHMAKNEYVGNDGNQSDDVADNDLALKLRYMDLFEEKPPELVEMHMDKDCTTPGQDSSSKKKELEWEGNVQRMAADVLKLLSGECGFGKEQELFLSQNVGHVQQELSASFFDSTESNPSLAAKEQDQLYQFHLKSSELLRHFWGNQSPTKRNKIIKAMQELLLDINTLAKNPSRTKTYSRALDSIAHTLETAIMA
eukprot:TRINITY_DN4933_c0_g1_i1.p1 TRINITY_DN4933_c0_g1~~TRINITY_DN4933_c0_g1_i1.p1  ORF type:complete len:522 (+),score=110.00 TRINITY_DN4933_c0_g1_i1:1152-2717(+)